MSVQSMEVTTENLLGVVVRMSAKEVDKLFKDAKRLKRREASLVEKIKSVELSPENEKIYGKLLKKFRAEKISPEEHEKLIELTNELEEISLKRLEWLYEISQIRSQPIDEIMQELNVKPKNYG